MGRTPSEANGTTAVQEIPYPLIEREAYYRIARLSHNPEPAEYNTHPQNIFNRLNT
jgi:hypothetical protein